MASDDLKTRRDAGEPLEREQATRRHGRKIGLNGDDAIEVAALSGRDPAELDRPAHQLAKAWNQLET